ncbi:MAG: HD domain-containing protein [Thermoanaerobaculia bacterium]|nr:HD domain-containing protein [Thermoanaerobaculia bacterium]
MSVIEIRDPIHDFIVLDGDERRVVDSRPFQRLRHITQLALTHLVYPGATHKRFEHSLGVMELATRIFDVVTRRDKTQQFPEVSRLIPEEIELKYWRRVLRLAALFHDVGHLPFSHAAEDLLPKGWRHEQLTVELILSPEMQEIWRKMTPPIRARDIVKLAVGPKHVGNMIDRLPEGEDWSFDPWVAILSEIITSDIFGADRMDYLLRDSFHAGVSYGRFDHHRLISTLRILPFSRDEADVPVPELGVERGGLQAAESLLWARYLMYTQMYFHDVRRIYDIHLADFLRQWLPNRSFPTDVEKHLEMTDNEVWAALLAAARDDTAKGHDAAQAIVSRRHYRLVYEVEPVDLEHNREAGAAVHEMLLNKLGPDAVRKDAYRAKGSTVDFPALDANESIRSGAFLSRAIGGIPAVATYYVFVAPDSRAEAARFLRKLDRGIIGDRSKEVT